MYTASFTDVPGYEKLTVDNFSIHSCRTGGSTQDYVAFSITDYDASTGIATATVVKNTSASLASDMYINIACVY